MYPQSGPAHVCDSCGQLTPHSIHQSQHVVETTSQNIRVFQNPQRPIVVERRIIYKCAKQKPREIVRKQAIMEKDIYNEPLIRNRRCAIFISLICKCVILGGLITGIVFLYLYLKPAGYNENCESTPCAATMVCLNKKCLCDNGYQYSNGQCLKKKGYFEVCSTISCDSSNSNLICANGICQCDVNYAWNGTYCIKNVVLSSYNGYCFNDSMCMTSKGLLCTSGICLCSTLQYWSGSTCVNYNSYGDSCSNTLCDPMYDLICNRGTACNCPKALVDYQCDCVRVYGNEYYWDASLPDCVPAVTYGGVCSGSYQCQTLTQQTGCYNGRCGCTASQVFTSNQCV